eukprot:378848-Rhodomonas_salina.2
MATAIAPLGEVVSVFSCPKCDAMLRVIAEIMYRLFPCTSEEVFGTRFGGKRVAKVRTDRSAFGFRFRTHAVLQRGSTCQARVAFLCHCIGRVKISMHSEESRSTALTTPTVVASTFRRQAVPAG